MLFANNPRPFIFSEKKKDFETVPHLKYNTYNYVSIWESFCVLNAMPFIANYVCFKTE